jgi:hypothetical protein
LPFCRLSLIIAALAGKDNLVQSRQPDAAPENTTAGQLTG